LTPCGKTAVVTGASSGIGEATARMLTRERYNVVLTARREDHLKDLATELATERSPSLPRLPTRTPAKISSRVPSKRSAPWMSS
jgi:NADP-dependent 3-hydroxy acid dehydrogenase YdfG